MPFQIGNTLGKISHNTWEDIEAQVDKSKATPWGGCWLWTGALNKGCYGTIGYENKSWKVHRLFYEHYVGPIPKGLTLDHWCRNRACCRPGHLEAVTQAENNRRAKPFLQNVLKTHCKYGHEFTEENTKFDSNYGKRACRICISKYHPNYHQKNKTKIKEHKLQYYQNEENAAKRKERNRQRYCDNRDAILANMREAYHRKKAENG